MVLSSRLLPKREHVVCRRRVHRFLACNTFVFSWLVRRPWSLIGYPCFKVQDETDCTSRLIFSPESPTPGRAEEPCKLMKNPKRHFAAHPQNSVLSQL